VRAVVRGPRRRGRAVVRRRAAKSQGPGVRDHLGCDVEGGGDGAEVGGGVEGGGDIEVGQPDGAKPNFTMIRVSCRWGYFPYTRYYWYQLT
jgi:hypothetical protein